MQGRASTSSRTRPAWGSVTAVTDPRRRLSIPCRVDELERDVEHRLEVGNGDVLGRGVDLHHPVGEIDARNAARVEDVRVGPAAAVDRARLEPGALDSLRGESEHGVVRLEAVAGIRLRDSRLDLALRDRSGERERVEHLLDEVGELALVAGARLGRELAAVGHDVPARAALDQAYVGGRLLVDPAEPEVGDGARG